MRIIAIILFLTIPLVGFSNDTTLISQNQKSNSSVTQDTARYKFQQDTITLMNKPQVSQIIYAEHENKIDVLMGYLFPIIMLLLGVGIDRLVVYLSDKKRIKKIGKRWVAELKSLKTPIENQQDNFNKFIANYCDEEDEFNIPDISFHSSINGVKFESLGKEDLYEYLEEELKEKKATEDFNKITSIISTLKATYEQLTKVLNDFKIESTSYINAYNSNLQTYIREILKLQSQTPMLGMSEQDFDKLKNLYQDEIDSKMPNINVFETKNSFILPSLKLLGKYNINDLITLNSSLMSCLDSIQGLRNEKQYIKNNIQKITATYTKVNEVLTIILSDLNRDS